MENRFRKNFLTIIGLSMLLSSLLTLWGIAHGFARDPLPKKFIVFTDGKGNIAYMPTPGYQEKVMPIINLFLKAPGCYMGCYSHNPDQGAYLAASNTSNIYMVGLIRVPGRYINTYCVPERYDNIDLSAENTLKELCSKAFRCIGNSCWAGSDTGGWFGLK